MAAWDSTIDRMLYEGEEVLLQVGDETVQVAVTSHRIHVHTPEVDGANYRTVDRPNVRGVKSGSSGRTDWLITAAKALAVGLVLFVGGLLVDFEGMIADVEVGSGASQVGVGQILGMLSLLQTFFAVLDDLLLGAGAIALLVGLGVIAGYYVTRESVLTIEIAGDEDVELPAGSLSKADRSKLEDIAGSG